VDADHALAAAKEIRGSWWPRWSGWLAQHSGGTRAAPAKSGNTKFKPIEPAPGRYVKQKA
jgi:polyhydroxyalkanoate synthase